MVYVLSVIAALAALVAIYVLFFQEDHEVPVVEQCQEVFWEGLNFTQCHMIAGHEGPHRMPTGEAFSTAKRKAREQAKAQSFGEQKFEITTECGCGKVCVHDDGTVEVRDGER